MALCLCIGRAIVQNDEALRVQGFGVAGSSGDYSKRDPAHRCTEVAMTTGMDRVIGWQGMESRWRTERMSRSLCGIRRAVNLLEQRTLVEMVMHCEHAATCGITPQRGDLQSSCAVMPVQHPRERLGTAS